MSWQIKPLQERLKMRFLKLDDAFVKFTNVYVKYKSFDLVSEIFNDMNSIREVYPSLLSGGSADNLMGQIFPDEMDWSKAGFDFLSEAKIREMDKRILVKERVVTSIAEFRRLLLAYPIRILYSKEDGQETHKMSNMIFGNKGMVAEIVRNRFSSFADHMLRVDSEEFEKAIQLYFSADKEELLTEEDKLKKDSNAYCMHALFGLFKYKEILEKFPNEESYGEDGEVSKYIQVIYGVNATFANRTIVLSLRALRHPPA